MIGLNEDGYPTPEYLEFIKSYDYKSTITIYEMVDILLNNWEYGTSAAFIKRRYKKISQIEFHTCGWSGNEQIINAVLENIWLTGFELKFTMWKVGGHYYFKLYHK